MSEMLLALFIMAVGLSAAGAVTHLYQAVSRAPAELSYAGATYLASMFRVFLSFVCGPYIMLQMGLVPGEDSRPRLGMVLLGAFVGFGWAFITGLLLMSVFLAVFGA